MIKMARFCSLFSSSSGNATFVGTSKSGILIDAGVSAKKLKEALIGRNISPESIKGVFITHEHIDHIKAVRVFCSQFGTPVFATKGTLKALDEEGVLNGKFPYFVIDEKGAEAGDMIISSFETPHDSNESCGYRIILPDERKIAVATDIGHMTDTIRENIRGCDLVMLESNHDIGMLQNGPYPYYLKRRILSPVGHLSNADCAKAAAELVKSGTTRLYLGHLSGENNFPDLAFQESYAAICETGAVLSRDYILEVNKKENDGGMIRF